MRKELIILVLVLIVIFTVLFFLLKKADRIEFLKFSKRIIFYLFPLFIIVLFYVWHSRVVIKEISGPSMKEQIELGFKNSIKNKSSGVILGNSRMYRGLNPNYFSNKCYNFSFDNETFLESWYKILYLRKNDVNIEYLILGVDYFEFSYVSVAFKDIYIKYFVDEYLNDLESVKDKEFSKPSSIDDYVNNALNGMFSINGSRYIDYIYRLMSKKNIEKSYVRDNGQYIIRPTPKALVGDHLSRSTCKLDIQVKSFKKIIQICRDNKIKLFMVLPPTRDIERSCYTNVEINDFNTFFSSFEDKDIFFLNYFENDFKLNDFMDDTHLNPRGADKFSEKLDNDIKNILKKR